MKQATERFHDVLFFNFQYQRYQLILIILTLLTITIHTIQPLVTTLLKNKTKQTTMSSLLMILTLHYAKATNYGHQTTATTTTTTKSALNSNKVSNLLFVRPEPLVFF